jgi:protoporphyrinogen oxidase
MIPYNYKVWAFPPEDMAYQWIGERVAITDLKRVTENILFEKDDFSWGPNNTFQFPLNGGTGAIWNAVGEMTGRDKIRLNSEVQEIDPSAKKLKLKDGTEIEYEILLSTMPVDIMTKLVKGLNPEIPKLASGLKHSSSNIIGIGLKGKPKESLEKKCWMYFQEKKPNLPMKKDFRMFLKPSKIEEYIYLI